MTAGLALDAAPVDAQEPSCPPELDGLALEIQLRDTTEEGVETLTCSYLPVVAGSASRVVLIGSWVPVGADPGPSRLCGANDFEGESDIRWFGFDNSDTAAAEVWYTADDQTLGVNKDVVRATAAALLAGLVEPLAQPCSGAVPPPPPTEPAATVPVPVPGVGAVCPTSVGELVLTSEVPETDAGISRVVCNYVPAPAGTRDPATVTLTWGTAEADPAALPACALPDIVESDRGYLSSQTAAASAEYSLVPIAEGSGNFEPALEETARAALAAVAAGAAPCPGPPTDIAQVNVGVPPAEVSLEELAFYASTLACPPSIEGFDLDGPGAARVVGNDWIALDCDYTRAGVDSSTAQEQDQAFVHVAWTKVNGRDARYCLDDTRGSETETKVFASIYDGIHSVEVESGHPDEGVAIRTAFVDAAADLQARTAPLAYVCPDFNEIAFDPIPPYWQPVFGAIQAPPPIILPDEVTAADVTSGAAYAGAVVDGGEAEAPPATQAEAAPTSTVEAGDQPSGRTEPADASRSAPAGSAETPSRSPLWRVVGIAGMVLSILGLGVAILLVRKQSRVRPRWDLGRLAIGAVTIVVMTLVIGVDTPYAFIAIGVVVGAIIGVIQGRNLSVRVTDRGLSATRNIVAAVAFAVGLVIVQLAGFLNRSGLVALGLTVSYLSAAMAAGLLVGRRQPIADARGASAAALGILLGAVIAASLAGPPPPPADAREPAPHEPGDVLVDMVDWDQITVIGGLWASQQKPPFTISVPRGLTAAPEDATRTVAWEADTATDSPTSYQLTESYSFDLDDEGLCCTVTIVADGTEQRAGDAPSTHHAEAVVAIRPEGLGGFTGITPFGDPEVFHAVDPADPLCGRPVAKLGSNGGQWTTWTITGAAEQSGATVELYLLTDCEVPGFTVSNALTLAPSPPPADSGERYEAELGPCPVLQEVVGPISDAAGIDIGATHTIGRLFTQPNTPVCDDGLGLGDYRPGGRQLDMLWSLATADVDSEVARVNEINTDFITTTRQFGIYDEDACPLDANGDILPPAEGEECFRRQFFAVGSEVTIWTEYVEDGPNVEVRGRFPWGSYWFYCHHCEPGGDMIRNAVAAWHRAGATAPAATAAEGPSAADASGEPDVAAPAEVVDEGGVTAVSAGDGDEIDGRDAAVAAAIALIGSAALAGTALAESGTRVRDLRDALRPGAVIDERGIVLVPDHDGLYVWETPDGVVRVDRADLEDRIAAARGAAAARDAEHQAIVAEHVGVEAAADRFDDLVARSIAQNDELMADIRDGWGRVDEIQSILDERARILTDLELAEAAQDHAGALSSWDQIALSTLEGAGRDVASLYDATGNLVRAAADTENWTIAGETIVETVYDSAGLLAGNTFGDGAESIGNGVRFVGEVGVGLGTSFVRDPLGTIVMLTPAQDFIDSIDGNRPLSSRLGSVALGVVDVGMTLSGLGVLSKGEDLLDAARAVERLGGVAETSTDVARASEAALDGSRAAEVGRGGTRIVETGVDARTTARIGGRVADEALAPVLRRTRQDVDRAIAAARAEAAARGLPVTEVLSDVPEVRSIYRGDGLKRLGELEAAGGLDDATAAALLSMHDEMTTAAVRVGTESSIDDMMRLDGVRPKQVYVGNSGSVGATRSVMTDADRTIVTVFDDADLDLWRARHGGTRAEAAQQLQDRFRDLHARNAELALNDAADPAVRLARERDMTLGEAVAHLDRIGGDDAAAAARRLTAGDLDMASYSGFGSFAGPADSYPAGFTRARMSIQGNTDVYRVGSGGNVSSYRTSGQAIIDQHELERVRHTGSISPADATDGFGVADPRRIPDAELGPLLRQQVHAIEKYDDVKSVAKAVDRVQYIAGRRGIPLADERLVRASVEIRANPRRTASILADLGMNERQYVDATKTMVRSYGGGV